MISIVPRVFSLIKVPGKKLFLPGGWDLKRLIVIVSEWREAL